MAQIILHRSPFGTGATDYDKHSGSLIDWLQDHYPNGFGVPIAVTLNGADLPLENLDIHLLESDVVEITVKPAGPAVVGYMINAIIAIAISYVVSRVFGPKPPKNPTFAETPQPSPIYSVAVAQNATRLGEAIPVIYGDVMTTPDYASQPYIGYTEVLLIDATAPPGYTIEYLDATQAVLLTTVTVWPQAFLFWMDSGGDWQLMPTGASTPGLVEGTYTMLPYGSGQLVSPTSNPFDPGAIRLDTTAPPTTAGYIITNSQSTVTVNIDRERGNNGDQYLCALLCIGCGEFEPIVPADVRIGNTTLDLLDPATFTAGAIGAALHGETLGPISFLMALAAAPGVASYWENCITALEVGDQELIDAGDQTLFFPIGDKPVNKILVDVGFPRGLYSVDTSTGAFLFIQIAIQIEVQTLIAGVWTPFINRTVTFTNNFVADVSPLRRSLAMNVSPGIYRVRLTRITGAAPTTGTASDAFQWLGLRGFIAAPVENNYAYGDCTLFALRIRANNLISESATSRIQVRAQRLIPGIGYTRSPAYCVRDIMENTDYGANRPPGVDIDWPLFSALHTRWAGQGGFSGGFTERVTIWEALTAVLTPGLAEPILVGGQVSARYEGVRSARVQVFNDANIVQNTLSTAYTFRRVGESDGFTVEYRNLTSWQPEYITYPVGAFNPERVSAFGVTDVFNGYLYGKFLHQRRQYTRKRIRFDVELEGHIPIPGDLIGVQQPMIYASAGGRVIAYNTATNQMTLEIPFTLPPGIHAVVLRDAYGVPAPSILITQDSPTLITLASDPPFPIADPYGDSPTLYAVGRVDLTVSDWLVDAVTHSSEYTFTIDASNYDERIYQDVFPFLLTEI